MDFKIQWLCQTVYFLCYKMQGLIHTFLKSPTGTMLFPLAIYIYYYILASDLSSYEYHHLIAPCPTSEFHLVNVIPSTFIFRWNV